MISKNKISTMTICATLSLHPDLNHCLKAQGLTHISLERYDHENLQEITRFTSPEAVRHRVNHTHVAKFHRVITFQLFTNIQQSRTRSQHRPKTMTRKELNRRQTAKRKGTATTTTRKLATKIATKKTVKRKAANVALRRSSRISRDPVHESTDLISY